MDHQTPRSAVLIPALQSLISGLLAGALGVSLGYVLAWGQPWAVGALAATGTAAAVWFSLLGEWRRFLAGVLGIVQPELYQTEAEAVRVIVSSEDGQQGVFADLPANRDQLITLGAGLVEGLSFSEGSWTGRGRPFSRSEFRSLRDELLRRGLARWVNPTARAQGVELTGAGRAVARYFASQTGGLPTLTERATKHAPKN